MATVSVIIPVYNVEEYLSECLDSVISQTYQDLEILCIDDCSTDHSLEILRRYAQKDLRIVLLENPENYGQACTRNKGLKLAVGEYILFVDSDDTIRPDLIESCMKVSDGCDMVCFDYRQNINGEACPRQYAYQMEEGAYAGELFFMESACRNSIIFAPWSRLFSRRFLIENNIFFYSGIIYEDVLFTFYCYVKAKNVYNLKRKLYTYRIRTDSTMTKAVTGKSIESYVICISELTRVYLRTDFNQKMSCAVAAYIRKVCREYICIFHKWDNRQLVPELLRSRPDDMKLYQIFSGLIVNHGKISDISLGQIERIRKYQYVILYGAGDIARSMVEILDRHDIPLYGVAVSDGHKNQNSLLGNPVRELWEYQGIKENCLVLIGMVPRYYAEIRKQLQKNGFSNWMEVIESYEEGEEDGGETAKGISHSACI